MPLTPIHVLVSTSKSEDVFETKVGKEGRVYDLDFIDLMNLISARQGRVQRRLEYRR